MDADPVRVLSDGIVLREWEDADLPRMTELFDDPEVARWTPLESPFDAAAARRYLDRARARRRASEALQLAVTTDGGTALGEVLLFGIAGDSAELGYAIGAGHRGAGLAARAVLALIEHARTAYDLRRFELRIPPSNAASRAVATASGFAPTGEPLATAEARGRRVELETWARSFSPAARSGGSAPR
jgi:RimJ/RimL family protein N-acetyltransferase